MAIFHSKLLVITRGYSFAANFLTFSEIFWHLQAASGAGAQGMTELEEGTRLALEGKVFPNEARFSSEFNGDDVAYMFYAIG